MGVTDHSWVDVAPCSPSARWRVVSYSLSALLIGACSGGSAPSGGGKPTPEDAGLSTLTFSESLNSSATGSQPPASGEASDTTGVSTARDSSLESGTHFEEMSVTESSPTDFISTSEGSSESEFETVFDAGMASDGGLDGAVPLTTDAGDAGEGEWDGTEIISRSGFVDIEAFDYTRRGLSDRASSARLFYSFRPADERPDAAPVFVFFNGGPGYATSLGLMSHGTGPMWVTPPEDGTQLEANPWSWTQLGNLLYIDPRQAGFSYSTLANPWDADARRVESRMSNYNDHLDAADLLRTLLRVLRIIPGIQDNPIVLVGESYGGVRVPIMLEYALYHEELRRAQWYTDVFLADEIDAHYAAIADAGYAEPRDQFAAQILIQPYIGGGQLYDQDEALCQPGTPELIYTQASGESCTSLLRSADNYKFDEEPEWSESLEVGTMQYFRREDTLGSLLGVELDSIDGLSAAERGGAYRLVQPYAAHLDPGDLEGLGSLPSWDNYFAVYPDVDFDMDYVTDPNPCIFFARSIARVDTFVTNAELDLVVDTPVIPTTMLRCHLDWLQPFLESIQIAMEPVGDEARPGRWVVTFNDAAQEGPGERVVRWPSYDAGHMVSATQPQQLFEDVQAFLRERKLIP